MSPTPCQNMSKFKAHSYKWCLACVLNQKLRGTMFKSHKFIGCSKNNTGPWDRQLRAWGKESADGTLQCHCCYIPEVLWFCSIQLFDFISVAVASFLASPNPTVASQPTAPLFLPRFRSVTHVFGEVGHTHGHCDQRLGQAASAFSASQEIQTPEVRVQQICLQNLVCTKSNWLGMQHVGMSQNRDAEDLFFFNWCL